MTVFASTALPTAVDGVPYSVQKVMPALEGDLYNGETNLQDPRPVLYGQALLAAIELAVTGNPSTNSTYVVLQTDLGDGVWFDIAWVLWTGTTGSANFLISAGVAGALTQQQTRAVGTAPASSGSIQCPLGGRLRFAGKTSLGDASSSSSPAPGTPLQVTVTIRAKILGPR